MMLAPFIARLRKKSWLWTLGLTGAVFGALPDLVGAYGILFRDDRWSLYNVAHFGKLRAILKYVPMYWLHLKVDSYTHGTGRRWWVWDERLWVEVTLWVVNLSVIALYVWIWRRNARRDETLRLAAERIAAEHR